MAGEVRVEPEQPGSAGAGTGTASPLQPHASRQGTGAMASHSTHSRGLSGKPQPEGPVPAALTFMYLLKTPWISSLMLGCRTARSRSMDTAGSVKLKVQSQGGRDPLPALR